MNKKKTLHVMEYTILNLKDDIQFYKDKDDYKGVYYTRGRIEALEQIVELIKLGRFD